MEFLKAIERKREADKAESEAVRKAEHEEMMAIMDAHYEKVSAINKKYLGTTEAKKKPAPEETEAVGEPQEVLEGVMEVEEEPAPEETEGVAERQEVPEGAPDEETFGATEDRTGEQRLAVRRHRQRKKRAQENGGPRQKFSAFCGRFTRRAVPAQLKGHVRKGPRKNRRSGVRGPGKTFRSRIDGRSLKQRQTQVDVARDNPEGRADEKRRRTRPECNSGIRKLNEVSRTGKRGRIVKRDRILDRKKTYIEAIRKSLCMEITKLIVGSFVGLREPGDGTLWKCRPPPKRKR
jgi:hypothetical protein